MVDTMQELSLYKHIIEPSNFIMSEAIAMELESLESNGWDINKCMLIDLDIIINRFKDRSYLEFIFYIIYLDDDPNDIIEYIEEQVKNKTFIEFIADYNYVKKFLANYNEINIFLGWLKNNSTVGVFMEVEYY